MIVLPGFRGWLVGEYLGKGCNPFPAPVVLQHCRSFFIWLCLSLFS